VPLVTQKSYFQARSRAHGPGGMLIKNLFCSSGLILAGEYPIEPSNFSREIKTEGAFNGSI